MPAKAVHAQFYGPSECPVKVIGDQLGYAIPIKNGEASRYKLCKKVEEKLTFIKEFVLVG
jgi:hypothetical protein